jgi:DNA-binding transcriptional LysR family regulator
MPDPCASPQGVLGCGIAEPVGTSVRKLSLRHLRSFVAVAETGSFTLAAARLFQTQSSLTATIQQFEEAVGIKLFDRTTRRVELTEDAARFKPVADSLLQGFDTAIGDLQAVATSQKGHVRVAAVPSVIVQVLTPALAAFRQDYPNITVSVRDAGAAKIERVVLDGEVDLGLCSRLSGYPELDYRPILRDRFGVVCPRDHALARGRGQLRWSDLAPYDYIAMTNDTGSGALLEDNEELGLSKKLKTYDRASSTTALYAMLGLGGKFSVLPALAAQADPLKKLKFRLLHEPAFSREICLVTRHVRSFSANTRRIVDALTLTIRALSGLEGVEVVDADAPAPPA